MSINFNVFLLATLLFSSVLRNSECVPVPQLDVDPGIDDLGQTPKGGENPPKTGTKDMTGPQMNIVSNLGKTKEDLGVESESPSSLHVSNVNPISNLPGDPETQPPQKNTDGVPQVDPQPALQGPVDQDNKKDPGDSSKNQENDEDPDLDPGMNQPGGSEPDNEGKSQESNENSEIETGNRKSDNVGQGVPQKGKEIQSTVNPPPDNGERDNVEEHNINTGEGEPPEGEGNQNPVNPPVDGGVGDNTGDQDNVKTGDNLVDGESQVGGKQNPNPVNASSEQVNQQSVNSNPTGEKQNGDTGEGKGNEKEDSEMQSSSTPLASVPPTQVTDEKGQQPSLDDSSDVADGDQNLVNGSIVKASEDEQLEKEGGNGDTSEEGTDMENPTQQAGEMKGNSSESVKQGSQPENVKGDTGLGNETGVGDGSKTGSNVGGGSDIITTKAPELALTRTVKTYQPTERSTGQYEESPMTMSKPQQAIVTSQSTASFGQDQNTILSSTSEEVEELINSSSKATPTTASQSNAESTNSSAAEVESTPNTSHPSQTTVVLDTTAGVLAITNASDHSTVHEEVKTSPQVTTGVIADVVATSQSTSRGETSVAVLTTQSPVVLPKEPTQASHAESPSENEPTTAAEGHIRKRPPANPSREGGGTGQQQTPHDEGEGPTILTGEPGTEKPTKTETGNNETATEMPLTNIVKKIVEEYGSLKVSLALLTVIVILSTLIFCCCKLCRRKGYRMRQRRLKEYGQEKEFLLNERNPKSQYNHDTLTLLDGSSEDEF